MPVFKPFKSQRESRSSTLAGSQANLSPQSQSDQNGLAGSATQTAYRAFADQRRPPAISRSQSQRNYSQSADQPPVDIARPPYHTQASEGPPPEQQYTPYNAQPAQQLENGILAPIEEPRSRFRDKFSLPKLGHSLNRDSFDKTSKSANALTRTSSNKRREISQPIQNYPGSSQEGYRQQWPQGQGSNAQRGVTHEEDEHSNIDPFQQVEYNDGPPVAQRDPHVPGQAYSGYGHQEHFPAPILRRVDTDQSSGRLQSGNEPYSAAEPNSAYRPPQYQIQADLTEDLHPNQQQYQAFQPSPISSHHEFIEPSSAQYSQTGPPLQQGFPGGQYLQPGHPPLALQQQQQHHYSNQADHQQVAQAPGQFPEQEAVKSLPPAPQQAPPNLHLQPGRPPSQQGPSSPTAQTPQYQAYGSPSSGQQQAPSTQSHGARPQQEGILMPLQRVLRGQDKQNQSGPPARESSLIIPPGQSQIVSPGAAAFPASVVPQTAHSQQYNKSNPLQPQEGDIGRDTPTPRSATDSMPEDDSKAYTQLQEKHRNLKEKYNNVKKHYFDKEAQVHALQNSLAHHRLSQSRTSLDDTEYFQRFDRLQGFIKELAYNIRKDWRTIPTWLHGSVNKEAIETGKQEMTAVGRAFLTRWLMEEVFDKHFHPDLDSNLSQQLKQVQNNIRRYSTPPQSREDEDQLSAKITAWRLATLEGLQDVLKSSLAMENRHRLISLLQKSLIAEMQEHLIVPPPPELDGGVHMIIELVIERIAVHIPLESRDVIIEYYPPGHSIVNDSMKIESACPALTNPIAPDVAIEAADLASLKSTMSDLGKDGASASSADDAKDGDKARNRPSGLLTGVFGTGKKQATGPQQQVQGRQGGGGSQVSLTGPPGSSAGPKEDQAVSRVRMAACMGVRIRGRQSVLYKAPVFAV